MSGPIFELQLWMRASGWPRGFGVAVGCYLRALLHKRVAATSPQSLLEGTPYHPTLCCSWIEKEVAQREARWAQQQQERQRQVRCAPLCSFLWQGAPSLCCASTLSPHYRPAACPAFPSLQAEEAAREWQQQRELLSHYGAAQQEQPPQPPQQPQQWRQQQAAEQLLSVTALEQMRAHKIELCCAALQEAGFGGEPARAAAGAAVQEWSAPLRLHLRT